MAPPIAPSPETSPSPAAAGSIFSAVLSAPKRLFGRIVDSFVDLLSRPLKSYAPADVTDLRSIKSRLKRSDVLLVCGNARISYVVKVLTLSPWSHVALYVGDRRDLLKPEEQEEWRREYGDAALRHLVIDADPIRGVHLKPLDDYVGLMIRHCRADGLTRDDAEKVAGAAIGELGKAYDVGHILRLSLFFAFPWEFLPEGMRRFITDFTLSDSYQICSRVLSDAFSSVGYPINPVEIKKRRSRIHATALGAATGFKSRRRSVAKLLAAGRFKKAFQRLADERYTEIHVRSNRHITPSDYDLSRFFSVIKDPLDLAIDYRNARTICRL